jgi:hypothetical protein
MGENMESMKKRINHKDTVIVFLLLTSYLFCIYLSLVIFRSEVALWSTFILYLLMGIYLNYNASKKKKNNVAYIVEIKEEGQCT